MKARGRNRNKNKSNSFAKARDERRRTAQETLGILETGVLCGQPIGHLIERSVRDTRSYPEGAPLPKSDPTPPPNATKFSVLNTTTLEAARDLVMEYPDQKVAVLNFASAKNPGGGFLNGSMAQEESLALHTGLYACLKGDKMYEHHRTMKGGYYTDWCIWSPDVPVFRREKEAKIEAFSNSPNENENGINEDDSDSIPPWLMSVVSSPCLNRSAMTRNKVMTTTTDLKASIRKRMLRLLNFLVAHHQPGGSLVLGAWGCGVFGNDPRMIANLFADLLIRHTNFQNRWSNIVFAVLDTAPKENTIRPFREVFLGGT